MNECTKTYTQIHTESEMEIVLNRFQEISTARSEKKNLFGFFLVSSASTLAVHEISEASHKSSAYRRRVLHILSADIALAAQPLSRVQNNDTSQLAVVFALTYARMKYVAVVKTRF